MGRFLVVMFFLFFGASQSWAGYSEVTVTELGGSEEVAVDGHVVSMEDYDLPPCYRDDVDKQEFIFLGLFLQSCDDSERRMSMAR